MKISATLRKVSFGQPVISATISGVSYGLVRASDHLSANVSGVSVLEYLGSPSVTHCVSGASSLRRVGP